MAELHELTAVAAAGAIARGDITSEALVRDCLERIDAREPDVAAWTYLNPDYAIAQARACDSSTATGLLHGVPVAFKDIYDTADMPTAYGSPIYHGVTPPIDAACVAMARLAGAVIMGKTVSTEFAGRHAGRTGNPHNRAYSPGGSSSGSAAAVADFMVPLAAGTQTGGSVLRPAAYCGVIGYKPTFGLLSFSGIRHAAETFDTAGVMGRTIDDVELFRDALLGLAPPTLGQVPDAPPRIAFCRTPRWEEADEGMHALLEDAATRLAAAGARVEDLTLPKEFEATYDIAWKMFEFEVARVLSPEWHGRRESLSTVARQLMDNGWAFPFERYLDLARELERLRHQISGVLEGYDVVLTPTAVGEAPFGLTDTGPVTFTTLWNALNLPELHIPVTTGASGLPIGVQLVAQRYEDAKLLDYGRWVQAAIV